MKRLALALLLASCAMAASGFDVTLPNEIPAYKDLNIVLNLEPGLKIDQARFYLLPERRDVPQYAIFKEKDGVWSTVIPSIYLRGDELMYYVQIRTAKGEIRRFPELGTRKARLLPDSTPPSLKVIYPDSGSLVRGQEQMIVCRIEDESEILTYEISYRGKPIAKSALLQNILSFFLTPSKEDSSETLVVVNLTDAFGNKAAEELSFALQQGAEPAFDAEAGYVASLDAEYNLAIGETANTTDLGAFFADLTHDVNLDYEFGAWTKLKAGPLRLQVSATLADEISVFDIPRPIPTPG